MAKRKPMGEGAADLFNKRTGADALAAVTGASSPAAPAKAKGKSRKAKAAPARSKTPKVAPAPPAAEASPRWMVTTIRIRAEHWQALRLAALERATSRGAGKADASEVLREVLDEWMASR